MMKFKFQSFVDLSTSASSMQIIQWSVGGSEVIERCRHLFGAYKYFKLGKISVKLVPASTLPVDPVGLSYDTTDPQTVDPRDQMNPGLVRITNGEDIFTNVASMSATVQEQFYYSMMLDPRWSKFMLQSGFRRTAYPMYWQVGQLSQDRYPGATVNVPAVNASGTAGSNGYATGIDRITMDTTAQNALEHNTGYPSSSARGLFQVGHKGKLGFLPTDYFQMVPKANGQLADSFGINNVPEVSVITCVLPKAYKTIYYYRCFITEEVIFTGLRSAPMPYVNGQVFNGLDNFLMGTPTVVGPTVSPFPGKVNPNMNNGGDLP